MAKGKRMCYDSPIIKENVTEKELSPTELEKTGPETKNGIVVNSLYVKVRKEPDYRSDVLELLRKGDSVTIIGKSGDFYKVTTSVNKIAYISSKFIKEE